MIQQKIYVFPEEEYDLQLRLAASAALAATVVTMLQVGAVTVITGGCTLEWFNRIVLILSS